MRRAALLLVLLPLVLAAGGGGAWQTAEPMPDSRSEVAAALVRGEIAIVGGFLADGRSSARVDVFSPATGRWRRLPDLPIAVNHAMAAALGGRLHVLGGYAGGRPVRSVFRLEGNSWKRLALLPEARAAAGAVAAGGTIYVVGGVGPNGLARRAQVYDPRSGRWSTIPGPTPREHLAAVSTGGSVYALAGRSAGIDTNSRAFERYDARKRTWRRLPPVPEARGGTGAAAVGRLIVSVGGEQPQGTIATVFAYDLGAARWRQLPDLPTPRHGLGVVAAGGRVYVIAGGREPGLHVSDVTEVLTPR